MMLVVALIGIIVALAAPNLAPLAHVNKLTGRAEVVAGLVDDARRLAYNTGRCYRVRLVGTSLAIEPRTHAECTILSTDDASDWSAAQRTIADDNGAFTYAIKTNGAVANTLIFRPSSRLWGDGDLDVTDDGARVTVFHPTSGQYKSIEVTPLGRVCVKSWGATDPPAPTAAVTCP